MPLYRRSDNLLPAAIATGVSGALPVASPSAKMLSTFVTWNLSVGINPRWSHLTPAFSKPRCCVIGFLPTAHIIWSKPENSPLLVIMVLSSVTLSI